MSTFYPRRVKNMATTEAVQDSSPRTKNKSDESSSSESDKTKSDVQNATSGGNTTDTSQRIYPKRSSQLPKLDSDSELDESFKNDNFNYAILNDSFMLSPCRNDQNDDLAIETPAGKLLRHVQNTADGEFSENISFVSRFNSLDLNMSADTSDAVQRRIVASTACKPTGHNNLEIIQEDEDQEADNVVEEMPPVSSKRKITNTPFKPMTADNKMAPPQTQSTTADGGQFTTPQIRSFSVHRRPRDLCSTQSQKSRSALANEFRSQKVLFQTPMSLSRAPLTCLPNDSVTLSLCDTINEPGSTPNTVEKSAEKNPTRNAVTKSKKSLEGAFDNTEKENKAVETASTTASTATSTTTTSKAESALKRSNSCVLINDVEYQVIKKLGSGGSSSVYLGKRSDNEHECALKVVDLQGDPAVVEGYMNETKLLEKLQGNICVVGLFDYQLLKNESKLLLVMEKGDSDLQKILQGYTTNLPLYVLMNYLYQILQAVNYIHQNGVIHSDLKPANFLMVNGRLKLIDFGIASNIAIDSTSIIKFSQAGTFNYISPEALIDTSTGTSPIRRNHPKIKISTKSDVWSLGCILYLFLYQRTPFSHIKSIYAKINAISSPKTVISYPSIPAYYPNMLVHMVKNCLQHNPKERPSCAELLQYPFHMIIPIQHLIVPTSRSTELPKQPLL